MASSPPDPRAKPIPSWKTPTLALMLMSFANYFSFSAWNALHTNFALERIHFLGTEMGILHTVREIPGFLCFAIIFVLFLFREQTLAVLSLLLIGVGVLITGFFQAPLAFYTTTLIKSLGFHYFETLSQSLSLQWFSKEEAPYRLGKVIAASSFATLLSYGSIFILWRWFSWDYTALFFAAGVVSTLLALFVWGTFPSFPETHAQHKKLIFRPRYWLYYLLVFMSGGRRQIFVVFSAFLMVQKFGYTAEKMAFLLFINAAITMLCSQKIGFIVTKLGERRAILIEQTGLVVIFLLYVLVTNAYAAAFLYMLDNLFFAMAIAQKTYFQKIADPQDIAPTSAVAFSINHIAAVTLPIPLGILWDIHPPYVFEIGSFLALCTLGLSFCIPHRPSSESATLFFNFGKKQA